MFDLFDQFVILCRSAESEEEPKADRRKPKMNKYFSSKTKKSSCWKRLKQKFTTHEKKNKCRGDIAHDVEPKMNKSFSSKTKKSSCWKRLKLFGCRRDKKNKKPCGFVVHNMNAEPKMICDRDKSVEEEPPTGSSLRHGEVDESTSSDEDKEYDVGKVVVGMWKVISKIGEGHFGFIYKAKNVISAKEVALKKAKSLEDAPMLFHEFAMMKGLRHINIVNLIDFLLKERGSHHVVLVLEYLEGGSLASKMHFLRKRTEEELWFPMKQMADAVQYLHSRNIVHRDIRPENFLYNNAGIVKLIDFSFAAPFTHGKKFYDVWDTPDYLAPEFTTRGYEGPPVDVWALGFLFAKLFYGRFIDLLHDKTDRNVGNGPSSFASVTLISLLTMMLREPMERFTMMEIVNHTWFKENHPVTFIRMQHERDQKTKGSKEETSPSSSKKKVNRIVEACGSK
uniref:serine/threonine-protein kinase MARK2-like n=1 Tax=Myxine glutinosa TaxID=7769 RepID=UPI00358EA5D4